MSQASGVAHEYQPPVRNLVALLRDAIARRGDHPLLGVRSTDGWKWSSYREFGELVDAFRGGLASLGVGAGDRVAAISNNRLAWAVGEYAAYGLGACYVPMYENQLDREWQFILADSGARVCLAANAGIAQRIGQLRSALPDLQHVITLDGAAADPHSYASLLELGRQQPVPAIEPDDRTLASLIYTSGTTGKPKGVKLSHFNLASNALGSVGIVDVKPEDRSLAFLPWAHVFGGCIELNGALAIGCAGAVCGDPTKLVEYLPEVKPSVMFGVPRVWNRIYNGVQQQMAATPPLVQRLYQTGMRARRKQRKGEPLGVADRLALALARALIFPKITAKLGGRLRCVYSGAAKLSAEVAEFFADLGIELYDGYGMTEAGGTVTTTPRNEVRPGSVGKPIRGVWLEIDESVAGTGPDEGEIIIHGHSVMQGYWNQDELTRKTLTADGGLRSGDIGRLDADGYLYVTGRVKELYKLENGKYVAPAPLEEMLKCSPFVAECLVFGADKPFNVALIFPELSALKAWAVARGISADDRDALLGHEQVRELFAGEIDKYSSAFKGYERISRFVVDAQELSIASGLLTPSLKVKRAQVLAKYASVLESMYAAGPTPSAVRASYVRELAPASDEVRGRTG